MCRYEVKSVDCGIGSGRSIIAAQDDRELLKTVKQGSRIVYDDMDRSSENQGCTTACSK